MATFKVRDKETGEVFTVRDKEAPKESLKEAWKISSPEELVQKGYPPVAAGLVATGQQLSSPLWKYGNMLAGGLPEVAMRKMGYKPPEAQIQAATPFGTKDITGLMNIASNTAGFIRGAPMKLASGAAGMIPRGVTLAQRAGLGALRGATQFGGAAGLTTPPGEAFEAWKSRLMRTGAGAGLGAVTGSISGIVNHFTDLLKEPAILKTGKQVRSGFWGFKGKVTKWYGEKLTKLQKANPETKVDISKSLKDFKAGLGDKAKFKSLQTASPKLRNALLQEKTKFTLKESQDLINELKSTVSENQLAGFKVRPSTGEVKGFIDSLQKAKQSAFPQMKFTDAAYGKMQDYGDAVESYMDYGKTVNGLKTMFNNPERVKALKVVLPKDIFNLAKQTVNAQNITRGALMNIDRIVRYAVIYGFMRDVVRRVEFDSGGDSGSSGGGE